MTGQAAPGERVFYICGNGNGKGEPSIFPSRYHKGGGGGGEGGETHIILSRKRDTGSGERKREEAGKKKKKKKKEKRAKDVLHGGANESWPSGCNLKYTGRKKGRFFFFFIKKKQKKNRKHHSYIPMTLIFSSRFHLTYTYCPGLRRRS